MLQSRFDWHERIRAIEREYWAVRIAVDELTGKVAHDPMVLGAGPRLRDLTSADDNLEGTYLIRMFAEFETAVRSYWRTIKPKARPRAEVLLDQLGVRRSAPADIIRGVHSVREFRNQLVHDRQTPIQPVTIKDARHYLATYLARLPIQWTD
ncbi:MAG TPA: hypothetical protein VJ783_10715 [Pirellulales bacterium]|nr:hypothetical protein [Pirellulales bacterium]